MSHITFSYHRNPEFGNKSRFDAGNRGLICNHPLLRCCSAGQLSKIPSQGRQPIKDTMAACLMLQRRPLNSDASCHVKKTVSGVYCLKVPASAVVTVSRKKLKHWCNCVLKTPLLMLLMQQQFSFCHMTIKRRTQTKQIEPVCCDGWNNTEIKYLCKALDMVKPDKHFKSLFQETARHGI